MQPVGKLLYLALFTILFSCGSNSEKLKNKGLSGTKMLEIRADYLFENSRYNELIPILDSLISLDSLNGKLFYQRAYSYGMLTNRNAAVSDYLEAIKMGHRVADSYYNSGINSIFSNDSIALYYFRRALEIEPEHSKAIIEINECMKRLKL